MDIPPDLPNIERDLERSLRVLADADDGYVVRCDRCLLSFGCDGRHSARRLFAHWAVVHPVQH